MAVKRPAFTENFSRNVTDIESFLGEEGAVFYNRLFERLVHDVVPNLSKFPQSGRSFLERSIHSTQAVQRLEKLTAYLQPGDDLRELIVDDYLILYLVRKNKVFFLSIKHHRQLSFDLAHLWRK